MGWGGMSEWTRRHFRKRFGRTKYICILSERATREHRRTKREKEKRKKLEKSEKMLIYWCVCEAKSVFCFFIASSSSDDIGSAFAHSFSHSDTRLESLLPSLFVSRLVSVNVMHYEALIACSRWKFVVWHRPPSLWSAIIFRFQLLTKFYCNFIWAKRGREERKANFLRAISPSHCIPFSVEMTKATKNLSLKCPTFAFRTWYVQKPST